MNVTTRILFLIALALLAQPAMAQEAKICGLSQADCDPWGLSLDLEECKCLAESKDIFIAPDRVPSHFPERTVCIWDKEASCIKAGLWFDAAHCQCVLIFTRPVLKPWRRDAWKPQSPGTITWREGMILVHRGEASFIAIPADVEALDSAVSLALQGADVEEIVAHGLAVVDTE